MTNISKIYTYNEILEELKKDTPPFAHEEKIEIAVSTLPFASDIAVNSDYRSIGETATYHIIKDATGHFLEDDTPIKKDEFAIVLGRTKIKRKKINDFNCNGWIFSGDVCIDSSYSPGEASFSHTLFLKDLIIQNSQFSYLSCEDIEVFGKCNFDNTRFDNNINLRGCVFHGTIYFKKCIFLKEAFFHNNEFQSGTDFEEAVFFSIDMVDCDFAEKTELNNHVKEGGLFLRSYGVLNGSELITYLRYTEV